MLTKREKKQKIRLQICKNSRKEKTLKWDDIHLISFPVTLSHRPAETPIRRIRSLFSLCQQSILQHWKFRQCNESNKLNDREITELRKMKRLSFFFFLIIDEKLIHCYWTKVQILPILLIPDATKVETLQFRAFPSSSSLTRTSHEISTENRTIYAESAQNSSNRTKFSSPDKGDTHSAEANCESHQHKHRNRPGSVRESFFGRARMRAPEGLRDVYAAQRERERERIFCWSESEVERSRSLKTVKAKRVAEE